LRIAVWWFIVCLGSNLFGSVLSPNYAIGSDPIVFGMLAALVAIIVVKWN